MDVKAYGGWTDMAHDHSSAPSAGLAGVGVRQVLSRNLAYSYEEKCHCNPHQIQLSYILYI